MNTRKATHILIVLFTLSISLFFFRDYGKNATIFYGDGMGYYMYLPATFIYHNNKSIYELPKDKGISSSALYYVSGLQKDTNYTTPKGYQLNQYTIGIAAMEAPFFFIAHAYEKMEGLPANGYSDTYANMIKAGTFIYALLGLLLTYYILKRYFNTTISLLTVCAIFLGSNLFWFSLYQAGMAHVPLFFLYALLIWLSIRLYEDPRWYRFAAIGFTAGMISLIRPTDIVCLLIPLLYNVYNKETLKKRLAFIKNHAGMIVFMLPLFLIPFIPQFLYWKELSGSYLYYSYGARQSFNWLHPKIIDGLFYYDNGWLAYSPIMYFALAGMLLRRKTISGWKWCLWLLFCVYVYIIYSWYCYNYINGLGSRPMIHLYPLLAIPFAATLQYISERKLILKIVASILVLLFSAVNISYSMQEAKGILRSERSNIAYNMDIMFRMHINYNDLVTLDTRQIQPDENKINKVATLGILAFKDAGGGKYIHDTVDGGCFVHHIKDENSVDTLEINYDPKRYSGARLLKCSGKFMIPNGPSSWYRHVMSMEVKRGNKTMQWADCEIDNKIGHGDAGIKNDTNIVLYDFKTNRWGTVYFYFKLRPDLKEGDKIRLYVNNFGKEELYIEYLRLALYR